MLYDTIILTTTKQFYLLYSVVVVLPRYLIEQIVWPVLEFGMCHTTNVVVNIRKLKEFQIHTYIIGHYNPSVRIIDLISHTTYVVCVNFFIHKWRHLQFKVEFQILLLNKMAH